MKIIRLLPPAVTLVFVTTGLVVLYLAIATTDKQNRMLREHIAAARSVNPPANPAHAQAAQSDRMAKIKGPLDWTAIAGHLAEMQKSGGIGDIREITRLQQRLQLMTQEQIIAALDEIATLTLPANARALLEQVLAGPLIQKNPELALTRFLDHLQDEHAPLARQLTGAWRDWAQQDPDKAAAWLDRQLAAGKFESKALDGRNPFRMQFERTLVGALLGSAPAAAARRLALMPEDQRGDVIGNLAPSSLKPENLPAFARLVRKQVPANDQARTFALHTAQCVVQGGYPLVSDFLTRIKATPAELLACVEQAVASTILPTDKKLTREDVDAMREWVNTQVPNLTDAITGKALCAAALMGDRKLTFAEAAELAVQYGQAAANDNVLLALMENWGARASKEQARSLADKIADESRRAAILKRLE